MLEAERDTGEPCIHICVVVAFAVCPKFEVVVHGKAPPPPEPHAEPVVVSSPPVPACTQFPLVRPDTEMAVVEAYGNIEAVVEVEVMLPAMN